MEKRKTKKGRLGNMNFSGYMKLVSKLESIDLDMPESEKVELIKQHIKTRLCAIHEEN